MNKNYLEICIKGGGFEFRLKGKSIFNLEIPTAIVNDMEIIDPLGLEKLITDTVKAKGIKLGKANILLSNEIIFNKIVTTPEEEKQFFDLIPIESEKIIKKSFLSGNQKIAIAINGKFIGDVENILKKVGFKIDAIVPEAESIQDLVDFRESEEEKSSFLSLKTALILFAIVVLTACVLFFFIKKPLIKIEIIKQDQSATSQEALPTPTQTAIPLLKKSDIKIQILNKTKVAGLAKKVMEHLPDFSNIQVGNITGKDTEITDITFTSQVGESERNEIYVLLSGMFSSVASAEGTLGDFDIIIELGKQ